jgi:hypothetical protein
MNQLLRRLDHLRPVAPVVLRLLYLVCASCGLAATISR